MSCTAHKAHLVDFNICGVLCRACVAFPEGLQGSSGHMDASDGLHCWQADRSKGQCGHLQLLVQLREAGQPPQKACQAGQAAPALTWAAAKPQKNSAGPPHHKHDQ